MNALKNNPLAIGPIAIVGASARAAAFSVLRSGRKAVAADLFADADLRQHCHATRVSPYPEGLAEWLATTDCNSWLYTGALENYPDLIDRMAKVHPLLGNSGDALRRCRDPLELQTVFHQHGLSFPETRTSCLGLPLDGSWLCKTYRGSSGSDVWELVEESSRLRAEASQAICQQRIEGQLASAVFVLSENWSRLLDVTAQWVGTPATGAAQFQYAGSVAMQEELQPGVRKQLETLAQVLAKQFRLRGLVGVDLMLDGQQAWILEINPRYTASVEVVERIHGISAIDMHLEACLGMKPANEVPKKRPAPMHGKAILYAKQEVVIGEAFFRWAETQVGWDFESRLADLPTVGSKIPAGRPILTLFATASQPEDDRYLRQRIAEVESRLASSRTAKS